MAAVPGALRDSMAPLRRAPFVGQISLVAAAYFVAAKLSLLLAIPPGYATAVWPPSGIAVAAMLLLGSRAWPGVWAGAALVNFTVETSVIPAVAIGCGNSLEALIAAALIRRQIGVLYEFESGEDVVRFVAIAASSAIIGATIGGSTIALHDQATQAEFAQNWWTWWAGDAAGIILVTPLILSWSVREPRVWTRRKMFEAAAFGLTLLVAALLIFGGDSGSFTVLPLVFMIPPIIIWAAFRLGQREVTLASVAACSVAIWYTVKGRGPFALASLNETLLLLLAFVSTVVMTGLVLSAVVAQRSRATEALQRALRDLAEQAIRDPMTGLYNRRFLREFLARELMRAQRAGIGLAVIMMDLDHFKRVNDSFGHDAGDLVLTRSRGDAQEIDPRQRHGLPVRRRGIRPGPDRRNERERGAPVRGDPRGDKPARPELPGQSARQPHGIVRRRIVPGSRRGRRRPGQRVGRGALRGEICGAQSHRHVLVAKIGSGAAGSRRGPRRRSDHRRLSVIGTLFFVPA